MTFKEYIQTRNIYREKTFMPGQNDNLLDKIKGIKVDKDTPIKKMIFLDNAVVPLMHIKNLQHDIELPEYMVEFLKLEQISLTLWD